MGGASGKCLDDELVGGDIDVVRRDASLGRVRGESLGLLDVHVVECQLSILKLGEAVGYDGRRGASSSHISSQGFVSDSDVKSGAVFGDPGATERGTSCGAD